MTREAAQARLDSLLSLRTGLTSQPGIKSTTGRRRALEQEYQIAVTQARKVGINLGYPSKAKRRLP